MHFTNNSLIWLTNVLEERFGYRFVLEQTGRKLTLSQPATTGAITFDNFQEAFHQSRSDIPCATWDADTEGWQAVLGKPLFAPGVSSLPLPLVEQYNGNHIIHYDILGLMYWMLSRLEEIGRTDLDSHNRFPAVSAHAYKHSYLERPIVDEWLDILSQVIRRQWPGIKLKNHQFSIKVSHDVDHTSRYSFCSPKQLLRRMVGDGLLRRHWRDMLHAPWVWATTKHILHPQDPYNTFEWLMDVSDSHCLISSFYFMTGVTDPSKEGNYDFDHPTTRHLMRYIYKRGHEVGLHPSFNSYLNPQTILAEADKLRSAMAEEGIEQSNIGGRMHYLRWEHPTTMKAWEKAGMSYDSTLGYADRPGFRCGTCHEYPAFDPVADEQLKLRIRPLIAMECTVIADKYLGLGSGQEALKKFNEMKLACQKVYGCFSLLWHNSELSDYRKKNIYVMLLEESK